MAHGPPPPNESREAAAQQNLARLAALAAAPPGLIVAAIAAAAIDGARPGLRPVGSSPTHPAAWAALAELPGMAVWAWPSTTPPAALARDLSAARAALGEDTRAVLVLRPRARVISPPLRGEVGADVEGVDTVPLIRAAGGLDEGELVRGIDVPWSEEAEAEVARGGFRAMESRD